MKVKVKGRVVWQTLPRNRHLNARAAVSRYVMHFGDSRTTSAALITVDTDSCQIYATTEERKQRNRQAQAAFRERRTEYIKQLESTINMQEASLNNLNAAHRHTTDECLMLRYKNSLLERILLEKGKQTPLFWDFQFISN